MDKRYNNFIKSVSESEFIPSYEKSKMNEKETKFIPNRPKPISTKGEYMFYKNYYYNCKTGFEWHRTDY